MLWVSWLGLICWRKRVVDRLSRLYDAGALEAVMDGVVIDLSSEEAAEASAKALEAKLRDDPLKPEVKVDDDV